MNRKQWAMKGKDCRKKADGMNILCAICLGERRVWGRFCFKLWRACMGWLFVLVWAGCLGEIRWLCQKERVDCPTCDHYARRRVELFHGVNRSCPRLARDMNVADVCLGSGISLLTRAFWKFRGKRFSAKLRSRQNGHAISVNNSILFDVTCDLRGVLAHCRRRSSKPVANRKFCFVTINPLVKIARSIAKL